MKNSYLYLNNTHVLYSLHVKQFKSYNFSAFYVVNIKQLKHTISGFAL